MISKLQQVNSEDIQTQSVDLTVLQNYIYKFMLES